MSYFAEIDEENNVIQVLVMDDNDPNGDKGYQWLIDNLGGRWVETCRDTLLNKNEKTGTPLRGNFAAVGMVYDEDLDVFLHPKPYPSWVLDEDIMMWESPVPAPAGPHDWDEATLSWIEVTE